jgi:CDP-diacylglycerol--glycerol-3-phosphate 3-phosphatidyltransferase
VTAANKVTAGRFFLSALVFVALALIGRWPAWDTLLYDAATGLFLVTVLTDVLDGYLARKYGEVTNVGRIADPLVDKIVVCGSLILFQGIAPLAAFCPPWMVVVVVIREFVVSGLRSFAESKGIPFAATFWGKLKMALQCTAAVTALIVAAHLAGQRWAVALGHLAMWAMLAATVVSGAVYVSAARTLMRDASGGRT